MCSNPTQCGFSAKQSGAAEACWAHNPEVDGSKPSSAKRIVQQLRNACVQIPFRVCKATGACWAHNPDVHESNTSSAICKAFFLISAFLITTSTSVLMDTFVQIPCIMKRTVIVLRKQHVFKSHAL